MPTTLQKWGNSLAVRIPKDLVNQLELIPGQPVHLHLKGRELLMRKSPIATKIRKKNAWRDFIIPTNKKPEDISGNIDTIVYGTQSITR
jgi:antitoxin MazE